MIYRTGWRQDPPDTRDRSSELLLRSGGPLGASASLEAFLPPILNQQSTQSCVGQAGAGAIFTRWKAQGSKNTRLPSPLWLYSLARSTHDAEEEDRGTYIRGLFKACSKMGIAPEEVMPFEVSKVNVRPSWGAVRTAYDQRWLQGYYRIWGSGQERISRIKQALAKGYPVLYGMAIDDDWYSYHGGILQDTVKSEGGHATFLYGYNDDEGTFLGQNSWGRAWGEEGRYRITQEAIGGKFASDFWVFEAVPKDSRT